MKIQKALLENQVLVSNLVKEAKLFVGAKHHIAEMELNDDGWLKVTPYPTDPKWPPVLIPPSNILCVTPDPAEWEERGRMLASGAPVPTLTKYVPLDPGRPPTEAETGKVLADIARRQRRQDRALPPNHPFSKGFAPKPPPEPDEAVVDGDYAPPAPRPPGPLTASELDAMTTPPDPDVPPAGATPATDLRGAALEQFRAKSTGLGGALGAPPASPAKPAPKRKIKPPKRGRSPKRRR